jgi:DNA end-binding protein Ku
MRPIWTGAISFGLINIPVALYAAAARDELKFRLLRANDLSPVNYKRVADADGKEVPWDQIVKGYEYEKGRFVVIKDEDFKRVDVEATKTVEIMAFVRLSEINPMFFYKPYYMKPSKVGAKAYALLSQTLRDEGLVAVAKVVIKTRQYLASVKAQDEVLLLELMHFANELVSADSLEIPASPKLSKNELAMAKTLVGQMTEKWEPQKYKDDYKSAVMGLIEKKIESGGKEVKMPAKGSKGPTNVVDLAEVLRQSLREAAAKKPKAQPAKRERSKAA